MQVIEVVASAHADLLAVPLAQLQVRPGARLDFGHVQMLGDGALGSWATR